MPSVKGLREITDEGEAQIQAGIAQDPDNPELTDEQIAQLRPAHVVLAPELFAALTRGQPQGTGAETMAEAKESSPPLSRRSGSIR